MCFVHSLPRISKLQPHIAPPHRGVGFGIDRLVMILLGVDNIREVIAFPKTATAQCPLTGAPAAIDQAQWDELHLKPAKE